MKTKPQKKMVKIKGWAVTYAGKIREADHGEYDPVCTFIICPNRIEANTCRDSHEVETKVIPVLITYEIPNQKKK